MNISTFLSDQVTLDEVNSIIESKKALRTDKYQ